jgi:hypothetical protein
LILTPIQHLYHYQLLLMTFLCSSYPAIASISSWGGRSIGRSAGQPALALSIIIIAINIFADGICRFDINYLNHSAIIIIYIISVYSLVYHLSLMPFYDFSPRMCFYGQELIGHGHNTATIALMRYHSTTCITIHGS